MGGNMYVSSNPGTGSTFSFMIPLELVDAPPPKVDLNRRMEGKRILVVDDNDVGRADLAKMLAHWDVKCTESSNVSDALKLLREWHNMGAPFHAVILDLGMAGISGLDMARIVRSDPSIASTVLVAIAQSSRRFSEEARKLGIDHHIAKPVPSSRMRDVLMAIFGGPEPVQLPAPGHAEPAKESVLTPASRRLLVVDDNSGNCVVAQTMLAKLGFECDVAVSGRESVQMVQSHAYPLILMDLQMPDMDGLRATAAIRAFEEDKPHTPIIAVTASALVGDRERCIAGGMDDYISKPYWPKELAAILHRWIPRGAAA
jgi:hypothetical protein